MFPSHESEKQLFHQSVFQHNIALTTTSFNVSPSTLCTVLVHASVMGNCSLCNSGEDCFPDLTVILANTG